jgi:glucokinase
MALLGIDIGGTSVKMASLEGDHVLWTGVSPPYSQPNRAELIESICRAAAGRECQAERVGLCVPGLMDPLRRMVTLAVNVPGINGVPLNAIVFEALGISNMPLRLTGDAVATGLGIWFARKLSGRLLCIAIGTGIGAAVLDDGVPLRVSGDSPGHLGQVDVSLDDDPPVGPDGGAGGLEGYLGTAALRATYGDDISTAINRWHGDEPPLRALARAIRVCHAIYRPDHVVLAGGLGIRMGHVLSPLRARVDDRLTRVARPNWTLSTGDSDYHAAIGAAIWAANA